MKKTTYKYALAPLFAAITLLTLGACTKKTPPQDMTVDSNETAPVTDTAMPISSPSPVESPSN